ncbi:MAG: LacI family transcriptional regulator [Hyphomicrobiales bacterium]|nr:MAG: LacI family transcriptional regulator [Hyphomicrobiales bacterium]
MSRSTSGTPSIRDVARTAGVSVATASRVMAKANYPVAEPTRQKVLEAARSLGFVANALARSLARARTDIIGVVVPVLINPYYAAMVEAIDQAAREHGLTMLLSLTGGDERRREAVIDDLLARRVDGLIVCAGAFDHQKLRSREELGMPAVLIGQQANNGLPIIRTDNRRAGHDAAAYLWGLGHRRFAYLTSLKTWHDFHDRGRGMMEFLAGTGVPYEAEIMDGLFGEADSYARVRQECDWGLRATALIASTDRHALGALAALADAGRSVPGEVSVMGFDDYVTSGFVRPSLTTMQMLAAEMGRRAVEMLKRQLLGKSAPQRPMLQATLVERGSTGPAAG